MASCSWTLSFSFTIAFFLIFFIFPSAADLKKVDLSVYYESLCPSCAKFIVQSLSQVFNNGLIDIINLRMIPWGNAHLSRYNSTNATIICQHGPDECQINTIQACAINVFDNVNKNYGFISCIEFLVVEGRHQNWKTCFDSLGLPGKQVLDCYSSVNGTMLDIANGFETGHLNPPHTFTPWVVVNNLPIKNDYENYGAYVCKAYKGNAMPNACNSHQPRSNRLEGGST